MVRIINGEIVQDNDPRLKNLGNNSSSNGATMRAGRSNVKDVFSSSSSGRDGDHQQPSSDPRQRVQQQQGKPTNPLEMAATALGIQDRFVTIPAVQQVGLTETRVGLIYVAAVGLACFAFGYQAALVAVGGYVLWKKSDGAQNHSP
jgi:hypothetical protein